LSLVYGPRVNGKQGFLAWMKARLTTEQLCDLFVDEWRTPVSTYDIQACTQVLIRRWQTQSAVPPLIHLAGAQRLSRFEFGKLLVEVGGYNPELLTGISQEVFNAAPKRPRDASLNCALLASLLGRPPLAPAEGLAQIER
jgi:dTDP-4-dehydrorhamnose reductase